MFKLLMIQADLATELDTLATEPEGISTKFIDLAFKGGWIMIPIIALSIIAVYIFFDRFFAVKKAGKFDAGLLEKIKVYITNGKIDDAVMLCRNNPNPASRMLEKGISRIGRPLTDVSTAIENVGNLEISKLEKGLPVLASVAGGAPMLGFLGTVMGMIQAFYDMANAGNNIDVTLLSTGIYQAMVTTVAGLIVGIIAYFAYNILVTNVEKVVFKMEATTTEFMDLLNEPV
ncbi:outer membrane transport energization protein ExbB [Mariniphaga anaerophila]|uniref:Outer membrane transport energization protein ExbB n=1 Tax=Mariniphaga anaerophila TaxID=1484053 RepID=A0A1M4SXY3_9BACT|nr:MotA/TolQ/ExbB proton channel family protein [Mariniphaga anaerophila]SHE37071.1 outer membrane transport energization protein ExbB [Mariniphaga anaerophila]